MNFSELLEPRKGVSIEEVQKLQEMARQRFPSLLKEKGLVLRKAERPIPSRGNFVTIGIAAGYSLDELRLLDELSAALQGEKEDTVEIFDVSALKSMEEFQAFIPGIASAYQTPVVGLWVHGNLRERKTGYAASEFLRSRYLKSL